MYQAKGKVRYANRYAVLDIDDSIVNYYRSLIPKYYYVAPQMYKPHITIIRLDKEYPDRYNWGYMDGEEISFSYNPYIYDDGMYWWLDAWSPLIGKIRWMMGLEVFRPPFSCYHITLGNTKHEFIYD